MSEFILIVPEGWTQLDWDLCQTHAELTATAITNWAATNQLSYIEQFTREIGAIPANAMVEAAKMIDDSILLVRLAY